MFPDSVATNTGDDLLTAVPSPNWPEVPRPQAYNLPLSFIANVCASPAATVFASKYSESIVIAP